MRAPLHPPRAGSTGRSNPDEQSEAQVPRDAREAALEAPPSGGRSGLRHDHSERRRLLSAFGNALARKAGTAARLATLHAIVLAAVIIGSVLALLHTTNVGFQTVATRQLDAELQSFQQSVRSQLAAGVDSTAPDQVRALSTSYLHSHAVGTGNLVEISRPHAWAIANADGSLLADQPVVVALSEKLPSRTRVWDQTVASRDVELMVSPIRTVGPPQWVFIGAVDLTGLGPARDAAVHLALVEAAVALVAGVGSAYLFLRRLLRRIGRITETAETIGRDRLARRLGDQGTADEVGRLAGSFDSMLDRIETAVNAQEALLADVSHQLRTPLTVARGHLEILQRQASVDPAAVHETLGVAIGELDRMGQLVERLLALGRAREPVRLDAHEVDLRTFLADFIASSQVLADRRWGLAPVPDEVAYFDETEVRGALLNLVDNAVKATTEGDSIVVTAVVEPGVLRITVEDSGPGIPAADRHRVLERFSRPGGRSGEGTGLGLAIVDAVCRAHDGRVEISESPLGGAAVTMILTQPRQAGGSRPAPAEREGHQT